MCNNSYCIQWFTLFSGHPLLQHITHTHPFNGPLSGTTRVSWYQKGKTSLDFTEARYSECQWHQLGHMQACTLLQTDNHASTPQLSFLQAGCPSCRPTNSIKALKGQLHIKQHINMLFLSINTVSHLCSWHTFLDQMSVFFLPCFAFSALMLLA